MTQIEVVRTHLKNSKTIGAFHRKLCLQAMQASVATLHGTATGTHRDLSQASQSEDPSELWQVSTLCAIVRQGTEHHSL